MEVRQIDTPCLAEATYYIESDGVAAVVDSLRDIEPYLELARQNCASIKYVFETHSQADFVSPCGRNISAEPFSIIAVQKISNAAFAINNQQNFVTAITGERHAAPLYFIRNAAINSEG